MSEEEATKVKRLLHETLGWNELAEYHPKFVEAVNSLPNCEKLKLVNSMVRQLVYDALSIIRGMPFGLLCQ